jgi:hypothetical protein
MPANLAYTPPKGTNVSCCTRAVFVYTHASCFAEHGGWFSRVLVGLVALILQAVPAGASFREVGPPAQHAPDSELVMTGTGPGQGVAGFIANAANPFDPVVEGYPGSNPADGFTPLDEGFAGIIHAAPPGSSVNESLYCIGEVLDVK